MIVTGKEILDLRTLVKSFELFQISSAMMYAIIIGCSGAIALNLTVCKRQVEKQWRQQVVMISRNHEPEGNDLQAFLGNSGSLSVAPLVNGGKNIPSALKLIEVLVTKQVSHTHRCSFQRNRFTSTSARPNFLGPERRTNLLCLITVRKQ